jgi:hypothetical protein
MLASPLGLAAPRPGRGAAHRLASAQAAGESRGRQGGRSHLRAQQPHGGRLCVHRDVEEDVGVGGQVLRRQARVLLVEPRSGHGRLQHTGDKRGDEGYGGRAETGMRQGKGGGRRACASRGLTEPAAPRRSTSVRGEQRHTANARGAGPSHDHPHQPAHLH